MKDCLFCRILSGEIPAEVVYEDDFVLGFLDIGPVSKGHTLLIPKRHAQDLTEGSEEDAAALGRAVYRFAPRLLAALGGTGYNLGMNHGADAGQEVFHTHWHVMPRFAGDARNFIKMHPSREELHAVAEQIRGQEM